MKITPVASPAQIPPNGTPESVRTAKAIQAFKNGVSSYEKPAPTTGQVQETAVANPNNISPEEMSAVKAPTQEETPIETAPTETSAPIKEEPKKDEQLSKQFAQLAKQERQLRARAQEQEAKFKQREAQLLARESEAKQKSEINQKGFISIDSLKADPIGKLQEAGLSYDEIANQMMNPSKIDPRLQATIDSLKAEIQSLRKATDEGREQMTQQQQAAYDSAVKQITVDARNLVNSDPNFETIKTTGSVKDVVQLITETYNKDGVLMTVEEAANEVENYLVDEAMKLTKIEKIKRKLGQSGATPSPATKTNAQNGLPTQPGDNSAPTMKTLTNAASSTRKLSARERALLAFKGELK